MAKMKIIDVTPKLVSKDKLVSVLQISPFKTLICCDQGFTDKKDLEYYKDHNFAVWPRNGYKNVDLTAYKVWMPYLYVLGWVNPHSWEGPERVSLALTCSNRALSKDIDAQELYTVPLGHAGCITTDWSAGRLCVSPPRAKVTNQKELAAETLNGFNYFITTPFHYNLCNFLPVGWDEKYKEYVGNSTKNIIELGMRWWFGQWEQMTKKQVLELQFRTDESNKYKPLSITQWTSKLATMVKPLAKV